MQETRVCLEHSHLIQWIILNRNHVEHVSCYIYIQRKSSVVCSWILGSYEKLVPWSCSVSKPDFTIV